jgi:hypothetical protein
LKDRQLRKVTVFFVLKWPTNGLHNPELRGCSCLGKAIFVYLVMKAVCVFYLIVASVSGYSQTTTFEFTLIDSVKGTKSELYIYARTWLASAFKSSKSVIEMEDKESGTIIGKGIFIHPVNSAFGNQVGIDIISFTITINTKDNKYRAVLSNFFHTYLQQTSTYIPGQPLTTAVGKASSQSRDGGSLDDEKPDCGTFMLPKKQWTEIQRLSEQWGKDLLQDLKKTMVAAKSKSDFLNSRARGT